MCALSYICSFIFAHVRIIFSVQLNDDKQLFHPINSRRKKKRKKKKKKLI